LLILGCAFISSAGRINLNRALRCYIWDEQREKWDEFRRKKRIGTSRLAITRFTIPVGQQKLTGELIKFKKTARHD
jgi:hypothetical protein